MIEHTPTQTPAVQTMLELGMPLTDADIEELFRLALDERRRWYGTDRWPPEFGMLASHLPAVLVAKALAEVAVLSAQESFQLACLESSLEHTADNLHDLQSPAHPETPSSDTAATGSWLLAPGAPILNVEQLHEELARIQALTDDSPIWRDRFQRTLSCQSSRTCPKPTSTRRCG